jgi:hypothetical protein
MRLLRIWTFYSVVATVSTLAVIVWTLMAPAGMVPALAIVFIGAAFGCNVVCALTAAMFWRYGYELAASHRPLSRG